jgi:hypothetical protein
VSAEGGGKMPAVDTDNDVTLSERQEAFLALIEESGIRDSDGAVLVGVSRWAVWRWKKDPEFALRYQAARQVRLEHLIKEAERRAMNGSDKMLEFLLCNYAPDKFSNKQKLEHSGEVSIADRLARARQRTTEEDYDLAG